MKVNILFEPRDLWIGVYWKTYTEAWNKVLVFYVCIIPMLPIRFTFYRGKP